MQKVTCFISHRLIEETQAVKGSEMRKAIISFIREAYPSFSVEDYVSHTELNKIRHDYLLQLITQENNDITSVEKDVINAISENKILSEDVEPIIENQLTMGQRAADKIASFGGSWRFIITFFVILLSWIIMNAWFLGKTPFDPYPFILLNLILSCLAAVQAPIIMMSQNRLEQKDRMRGENDYKINLKSELEIKLLHEKIDHLTFIQNRRLLEVQQLQVEFLDDILNELKKKK